MTDPDHLSRALQLIAAGQLDEARIYLEELLRQDPDNPDLLYNLGLCYVDLGQLDRGIELLLRCLQIAPQHSHACVALGIAYLKLGDLPRAKEYSTQALAADPSNSVALKNLGAILGQEGDSLRALYYLRRSFEADPKDPQTVYGLAFACMELEDIEQAQKHFQNTNTARAAPRQPWRNGRLACHTGPSARPAPERRAGFKLLNFGIYPGPALPALPASF